MKYVDEFRDRAVATALAERIKKTVRRPWTIMEVCGGQTHSIVRFGLDSLLPLTSLWFRGERGSDHQGRGQAIVSSFTKVCARACIAG
jgi:hypothetical protein